MTNKIGRILIRNYSGTMNSIVVEKFDKIATIGINRPEKRNCIDSRTAEILHTEIETFENDDSLYAAVLYGLGGNFCSGYDLKELSKLENQCVESICKENGTMGPTRRLIKKPLVAALSGYAVAGGLELALMCDLRVIEENAVLGVYNRRFGVPLIDGGTVRLQAMVGLSRALDLILTGRSLTAKEAFDWGIANRIVACGTALGQAIQLAISLVKFPQNCLLSDRNSTYNAAFNAAYKELLDYELQGGKKILSTESVKGAQRFVDGVGRHGKSYNLTEKPIPEWEREFDQMCKPKSKL